MQTLKNIGITSIDSLKLSFDLKDVDILNSKLLDHKIKAVINQSTGEIESETPIQLNSLKHQYEEYKIHFSVGQVFGKDSTIKEERLVVLLNSKLLESEYMDGLSMNNIEKVYNKLMEANIFHIPFLDFISKGMVSDIDVKKDMLFESIEEFDKIIRTLDNATTPDKRKGYGSNPFTGKKNKGIEWNDRVKSTFNHPFLKIYHKGIESKHGKNLLFFANYIDVPSIKDVVRIEATIKNFSQQGSKYGFEDNTLLSLLKQSSDSLHKVIEHSLMSNLEKRIKEAKPKTLNEYSPTDMVLFKSLSFFIQQNFSIDTAINFLIEDLEAVPKSRMKKKLFTIYESEIKGEIAEIKSRNVSGFFDSIGWI